MNYAREISNFFQYMSKEQKHWNNNPLSVLSGETSFPAAHPVDESHTSMIPFVTGSKAEFYVRPMLTCTGDIDVMFYYTSELALPAGYPPPSRLPIEFDKNIKVYEITDSLFPCYVYLRLSYVLTKCSDGGIYSIRTCKHNQHILSHDLYVNGINVHGPARLYKENPLFGKASTCVDSVKCMHCQVWPPQAASWPTRHRKCGWPNHATIDLVLSKGCDVVAIAHRLCKEDEWESKHQWRLSFSRAEVILLNSWTPEQQIVYHMLRVFVKNEQLTDSGKNVLSNYHIKTLMLWACEVKPQSWWTDNLVAVCIRLLQCLSNWVADARCQHYFVNNCNLLGQYADSFGLEATAGTLLSLNEVELAQWFLDNYVRKCAELCPDNTVLNLDRIQTATELGNVLSAVEKWRERFALRDAARDMENFFLMILAFSDGVSSECPAHMATEIAVMWLQKIGKAINDKKLRKTYMSSMLCFCLSIAHEQLPYGDFYDTCFEMLAMAFPLLCSTRKTPHSTDKKSFSSMASTIFGKKSSAKTLSNAADFMKEASSTCGPTELLSIELAKAYLYMTLKSKDSNSESVYCLANIYLALLYYVTGHYQRALDHCMLVTMPRIHLRCSSDVIQGQILPKIGDSVDHALGLAIFYHHTRTAALNRHSQISHVGVFTPELFAHYFVIKHLLIARGVGTPKTLFDSTALSSSVHLCRELETYEKHILQKESLCICDLLLFKIQDDGQLCVTRRDMLLSKTFTMPELTKVIRRNSIERLMPFRYLRKRRFGCVLTTGFEALHLYRCCLYERCVKVCQKTVSEEIETVDGGTSQVMSVTYSDFVQVMDSDIISILGLLLLINPEMRQALSTIRMSQLCLSLYVMCLSQLHMLHPVASLQYALDLIDVADGRPTTRLCPGQIFDRTMLQMSRRNLVQRVARLTGTAERRPSKYQQRSPDQCTNRCRTQQRRDDVPFFDESYQLFRSFVSLMRGC